MNRKAKILFICISIFFTISACSTSEESDKAESIAKNGISGIEPPDGVEVIDNIDEFEKVVGDQSYNRETDHNTTLEIIWGGGADTGDILYFLMNRSWIIYCDKNMGTAGLVCGKPDCDHGNETCNAYINDFCWGVQYYNGYLYTVHGYTDFSLTRVSVDGSERENLGRITGVKNLIAGDGGLSIKWIIHRGYVYYCYKCNDTEDVYYLNNSNCIYRKSLEKNSEPECIMALPLLSEMSQCQFIGTGSYVYMRIPKSVSKEYETTGYLYRYNTESGKLEWFKEWGDKISNMAIHDNKIYYSENNLDEIKTKMYCYDPETKEKSVFIETDKLAKGMRYDNDYMYMYVFEDGIYNMEVWNWNGEYIANLPCDNAFDEELKFRDFAGSDDENIYIGCMVANPGGDNIYDMPHCDNYTVIEYIEKEDIIDGEYELKEWSEMGGK